MPNDWDSTDFSYPSTRYRGSKRRLLPWITEHVQDLSYDSVLDVFGGTGSVSLLFKRLGKRVVFNDALQFNQVMGQAVIENSEVTVTDEDVRQILDAPDEGADVVRRHFSGIFFLDTETIWLDRIAWAIHKVTNPYKRAILLSSLFQACLSKRPFNLFHRDNLYLRTANVRRTFGNKTTWDHPFDMLFKRFVREYNQAVFCNNESNKVIGGWDALHMPQTDTDLVYLDPPYLSPGYPEASNYAVLYHFLEGLATYNTWEQRLKRLPGKRFPMIEVQQTTNFNRPKEIDQVFTQLLSQFQHQIIVLSYITSSFPHQDKIRFLLRALGKVVETFEIPHKAALSRYTREELLFIAI